METYSSANIRLLDVTSAMVCKSTIRPFWVNRDLWTVVVNHHPRSVNHPLVALDLRYDLLLDI